MIKAESNQIYKNKPIISYGNRTYKNRIIFLDFDGVINNESDTYLDVIECGRFEISKNNLRALNKLFMECFYRDIKIVISSTWSVFGLDIIKEFLYKFFGKIITNVVVIGTTNYLHLPDVLKGYGNRTIEIIQYLINNGLDNEQNYCFIDDSLSEFSDFDKDRCFYIDKRIGLKEHDVDKVIEFFEKDSSKNMNKWSDYISVEQIDLISKLKPFCMMRG